LTKRNPATQFSESRHKDLGGSWVDGVDDLMHRESCADRKAEEIDKFRNVLTASSVNGKALRASSDYR
jgi:hypothetical protein